MPKFKRNNGKIEVWDIIETFNEDEVKIVFHCGKEYIIPKNMHYFTCNCGKELLVDFEGNTIKTYNRNIFRKI